MNKTPPIPWDLIKSEDLGLEAWGVAGQISTDFLTIEQRLEPHLLTGVIEALFYERGRYVTTMGTGSLFQFKLLGNWDKVVSEAKAKAEEYNERLKTANDLFEKGW